MLNELPTSMLPIELPATGMSPAIAIRQYEDSPPPGSDSTPTNGDFSMPPSKVVPQVGGDLRSTRDSYDYPTEAILQMRLNDDRNGRSSGNGYGMAM